MNRSSAIVALVVVAAFAATSASIAMAEPPSRQIVDIAIDPVLTSESWVAALMATPVDGGVALRPWTAVSAVPAPTKRASKTASPPRRISEFRAVRSGTVAVAAMPLATLAGFSSLYAVDQIPFLGDSDGRGSRTLLDAARPFLTRRLAEDGLILLAVLPAAPVMLVLNDTAAGDVASDASGVRSPAERRAGELMPFRPYRFLGARGIPAETAAYPAWQSLNLIVANAATYPKLEPATRARIEQLANAAGSTIPPPPVHQPMPPDLIAALEAVGRQMADEWAVATGADGAAIIATLRLGRVNP